MTKYTQERHIPMADIRLVHPLPDPNNNNIPRDCILDSIEVKYVPRYKNPLWKEQALERIDEAANELAEKKEQQRLFTSRSTQEQRAAMEQAIQNLGNEIKQLEALVDEFNWSPLDKRQNTRRYFGDLMIPWPKPDRSQGFDEPPDTLRVDVDVQTFLPTLLRAPMPETIIDELRNKYSKFRDRHDDDFVEQKTAEDQAAEDIKALTASMIPRGARNLARRGSTAGGKFLSDDTIPVGNDELLERIGAWMEAKQAAKSTPLASIPTPELAEKAEV